MSGNLLRPGERELAFPKYELEPRAVDYLRSELPVIDFTANLRWFVYPGYRFGFVKDRFITSLDEGAEPVERRTLYVWPERGTKPREYELRNVLDKFVPFLCNGFELDYEALQQFLEQHKDSEENSIPTLDFIEREMKNPIGELVHEYGNLGLRFREISHFYRTRRDDNIHVRDYSGKYAGTIEEYFGNYLSRRPSKKAVSGGDLSSIFHYYREPAHRMFEEIDYFSRWTREVIALEPPGTAPLEKTFEILKRSALTFRWVGERLQIVPRAPSPLDFAYLWVVYRKIRGWSFKVCRSEYCSKVFLPTKRNQTFCESKCANKVRMKKYRAKSLAK